MVILVIYYVIYIYIYIYIYKMKRGSGGSNIDPPFSNRECTDEHNDVLVWTIEGPFYYTK